MLFRPSLGAVDQITAFQPHFRQNCWAVFSTIIREDNSWSILQYYIPPPRFPQQHHARQLLL